EGLYNSVFAAATFRNDGQLELLSAYFVARQIEVATKEFDLAVAPYLNDGKHAKTIRKQGLQLLSDLLSGKNPLKEGEHFGDRLKCTMQRYLKDPTKDSEKVSGLFRSLLKAYFPNPEDPVRPRHAARFFT